MGSVKSWNDGSLGTVELDASPLGEIVKVRLMRDVVRMYEANRRQGTAKVKTRGETNYTERKPQMRVQVSLGSPSWSKCAISCGTRRMTVATAPRW